MRDINCYCVLNYIELPLTGFERHSFFTKQFPHELWQRNFQK